MIFRGMRQTFGRSKLPALGLQVQCGLESPALL